MKLKFLMTLLISGMLIQSYAQDQKAIDVLSSLSAKTKAYKNFSADFTMSLVDLQSDLNIKKSGKIIVSGKKYRVHLDDDVVIGNGENRWTYQKESNEVYVDYEAEDEGALSPSSLFTIWESGFKQFYEGAGTYKGKKTHQIKLHPIKPGDVTYHTVKLTIDSEKMELMKVEVLGKEGDQYTYELLTFKNDAQIAADAFTFNQSKFPGAEIIDLR